MHSLTGIRKSKFLRQPKRTLLYIELQVAKIVELCVPDFQVNCSGRQCPLAISFFYVPRACMSTTCLCGMPCEMGLFTLPQIGGSGVVEQYNEVRGNVRVADQNIDSNDLMIYNSSFLLYVGDVWLLMKNCWYRGPALIDLSLCRVLRRGIQQAAVASLTVMIRYHNILVSSWSKFFGRKSVQAPLCWCKSEMNR